MRGREETQRERSMVDFRAETASSSRKTDFTETEDQGRRIIVFIPQLR